MMKKHKNYFTLTLVFLSIDVFLCLPLILCIPLSKKSVSFSAPTPNDVPNINYPVEKKSSPSYDTITGKDGWPHYRVFFWVPKTATKFVPYSDSNVKTDVSFHGPVEKWSVIETKTTHAHEKLVFIFVPKTFVYLYGNNFEKVIHLKYS